MPNSIAPTRVGHGAKHRLTTHRSSGDADRGAAKSAKAAATPPHLRVLVTFASAHGSTRGVAERISRSLRESGFQVDCAPIRDVTTIVDYDAVVVGSAVQHRAWLPDAAQFVTTHANELSRRPAWLYSVGITDALALPLRALAERRAARALAPLTAIILPRGTHTFSGVIRRQHLPLPTRAAFTLLGGSYGDFRDWPAIDAWATSIATDSALAQVKMDGHAT